MAILVDNTTQAENGTTSSTTLSWSHTCSGDERALVVVVPCSRAVTCSVTYNSVSMTSLASVVNGTNRAYIFGLAAPSIGSNTITVTYSANLQFYVAGAVSFTGVSQSDILGATASQTGTAGAKSLSLTTEANGSYLVDCIGSVGTVHTVGAGQTKFATPALNRVSSYKSAPTAGTNGTSWTGSPSTAYAYALVEILASLTQSITATGITSDEEFGSHSVSLEVNSSGITSSEAFGSHEVSLEINPSGITSAEAFGDHEVTAGLFITPTGIASGEAFGDHVVSLEINNTGITSGEAFGSHTVSLEINPSGITSAEAFGDHEVYTPADQDISPSGIPSGEAFPPDTLGTNLLACWKLDETSGTRADSWGDNDFSPVGAVGSGTGIISNAVLIDAVTDNYLAADGFGDLKVGGFDDFTVSVWVKFNVVVSNQIIIGKWGDDRTWYLGTYFSGTGRRFRFVTNVISGDVVSDNAGYISADTWYHVVAWHEAGTNTVGIKVNAYDEDTATYVNVWSGLNNEPVTIGRTETITASIDGLVDEAKFWDRLLTADEKARLYNSGSGMSCPESGSHTVYTPADQDILPTGIVSAEAFGSHTVSLEINNTGVITGEAFGDHAVSLEINNTGITSGEAFGDPAIPIKVDCTGITSGESFGTSQINLQAVCTSISSEESFSAQSSLFTDLISLWKLDETSGTRVDSIGDNDLTDNSTVGSATGLINSAASFTSALESLSIDDNASINVSGNINWSYSVWVKLANKTFSYGILNKGTPSTGEWHLEYLSSSDRFRFGVRGSAKTTVSANELGSPVAGVWYHILVWHDADNDEIGIQVNNGTSDVSSHSSGVKIGTDTFHIGGNPGVFNPPLSGGLIDEVKFWKKILTTQEKSDLYNSGSGISLPEQGIVLTLGPEPQTLETTGITSAESFGTSQLNLKIASNSINSSEDFGTSQINLEVSPTSVSSSESFGIANIGSQTVSPSSILSSESFGTSQINLQIVPISISSSESFGTLSVNLELVTSSISSEESFGTTQLNQEITPSGIESSEVFGSHTVELSGTQNVQPSGISSDESFGSATISLKVNCTGITSSESFGIHSLSQHILHTSITSEESFGSHILSDDSNVGYLFKRKILQRKSNIKLNDNRFTSLKLLDDRIGNVKISNLTQIKSKILSRRNKTKLEE